MRGISRVVVAALVVSVVETACSFVTTWDGLTGSATAPKDAALDDGDHAIPIDATPAVDAGGCIVDVLYCGGDQVMGDASTLYQCTGGTSGTKIEDCTYGCTTQVGDAGKVDLCRPCFVGGKYCGGDKIGTDPRTLYICNPDGTASVYMTCILKCTVNATGDDKCD